MSGPRRLYNSQTPHRGVNRDPVRECTRTALKAKLPREWTVAHLHAARQHHAPSPDGRTKDGREARCAARSSTSPADMGTPTTSPNPPGGANGMGTNVPSPPCSQCLQQLPPAAYSMAQTGTTTWVATEAVVANAAESSCGRSCTHWCNCIHWGGPQARAARDVLPLRLPRAP